MAAPLLTDAELSAALDSLPGWSRVGSALTRTYRFGGFPASIAFVVRCAFPAEALDHHPDLDVRYDTVVVTLSTHSAGGITGLDVELARRLDAIAG